MVNNKLLIKKETTKYDNNVNKESGLIFALNQDILLE